MGPITSQTQQEIRTAGLTEQGIREYFKTHRKPPVAKRQLEGGEESDIKRRKIEPISHSSLSSSSSSDRDPFLRNLSPNILDLSSNLRAQSPPSSPSSLIKGLNPNTRLTPTPNLSSNDQEALASSLLSSLFSLGDRTSERSLTPIPNSSSSSSNTQPAIASSSVPPAPDDDVVEITPPKSRSSSHSSRHMTRRRLLSPIQEQAPLSPTVPQSHQQEFIPRSTAKLEFLSMVATLTPHLDEEALMQYLSPLSANLPPAPVQQETSLPQSASIHQQQKEKK